VPNVLFLRVTDVLAVRLPKAGRAPAAPNVDGSDRPGGLHLPADEREDLSEPDLPTETV
jgi:hypothetical protein